MRLDKYLKISRLIKRRTVANEAGDAQRVRVNGRPARASYEVKPGDIIEMSVGGRVIRAEVLDAPAYATKESAQELYRILSE